MSFARRVKSKYVLGSIEYFYHSTPKTNLADIKRHGLQSNFRPRNDNPDAFRILEDETTDDISFSENLLYFDSRNDSQYHAPDRIKLRISSYDLRHAAGYRPIEDKYLPGEFYVTARDEFEIDPSLLEILNVKTKKWEPLISV